MHHQDNQEDLLKMMVNIIKTSCRQIRDAIHESRCCHSFGNVEPVQTKNNRMVNLKSKSSFVNCTGDHLTSNMMINSTLSKYHRKNYHHKQRTTTHHPPRIQFKSQMVNPLSIIVIFVHLLISIIIEHHQQENFLLILPTASAQIHNQQHEPEQDFLIEDLFGDDPSASTGSSDLVNQNKNIAGEWSPWSPWSSCSRICDGGISTSVRRCISRTGCIGPHKRNKLCNMQPCILKTNFRQTQCSTFNNKPYRDRYYEWLAYIDPTDPCSLTCKAKGLNFVAKLAPHITDGTRCTTDSLDVCVEGKCLSVGCDLQLGSLKKIDECGICGGDGSSCKNRSYSWSHRFWSNCSRPCAGGWQISTVVCFDESTQTIVDDIFCSMSTDKPDPIRNRCNEFDCKPTWETEEWSPCSKPCGIGVQHRKVHCMLQKQNHTNKTKVNDNQCQTLMMARPDTERKCNVEECAQWYEGPWSDCSETCGNGIQRRTVVCKNNRGSPSHECDISLKPIEWRNCSDISTCLYGRVNSQEDSPAPIDNGDSYSQTFSEPGYDIGPWSKCNVTCGKGFRHRSVKCIIYLEFSKTFATLPMDQCSGKVPPDMEVCYSYDCQLDDSQQPESITESPNLMTEDNQEFKNEDGYEWKITGFTECSASCLGGSQESIIECIRSNDNVRVSPELCDPAIKPETYTKICNDHPCLPRWNLTQFGECSKKCGEGGSQTRLVQCVHEVTRGPNNFVLVPDYQCPMPKPPSEQKCNQIDCPAKWVVEPWQKCSRECGGGLKKRDIYCVKDFVFGGLQNVSNLECSIKKPKITKQCNLKPCRRTMAGLSSMSNIHSIHELVRKSKRNHFVGPFYNKFNNRNAYKVEGKITVVEGQRIKLSCPDWNNLHSTPIIWLKGHDRIINSKRIAMAEDVMKIRNIKLTDMGVYKCAYKDETNEKIMHSMFLHVLPKKKSEDNTESSIDADQMTTTVATTTTENNNYYFKTLNELDLSKEIFDKSPKWKTTAIVGKVNLRDDEFSKTNNGGGIHELIASFRKPLMIKKSPTATSSLNEQQQQDFLQTSSGEIRFYEQTNKKNPSDNRKLNNKNIHYDKKKKLKDKFNVQFDWITTDWSNCTIPCGGFGFRIRHSQCYVKLGNVTRKVEDSFCFDEGLQRPTAYEACGLDPCYRWKTEEWSKCETCVDVNKAIQTRKVTCEQWLEGKVADDESRCFQYQDKPLDKQECLNTECVPLWVNDDDWTSTTTTTSSKCLEDGNNNDDGNGSCKPTSINGSRIETSTSSDHSKYRCVWKLQQQKPIDDRFCDDQTPPSNNID